jgi:hypothetical protein
MIFNFPASLTDAEDRLLKKIGILKEKVKNKKFFLLILKSYKIRKKHI